MNTCLYLLDCPDERELEESIEILQEHDIKLQEALKRVFNERNTPTRVCGVLKGGGY